MITPAYLQLMARYNHWQNTSLYMAADGLSDADRRADRGSFFKSIHATLSHLLWADQIWMSRFADWDHPGTGIPDSGALYDDWAALKVLRNASDDRLIAWAGSLMQMDIEGDLTDKTSSGTPFTRNRAMCLAHMFNHQTHHRGQVHAMLTAAGASPEDTDLIFMPEEYL